MIFCKSLIYGNSTEVLVRYWRYFGTLGQGRRNGTVTYLHPLGCSTSVPTDAAIFRYVFLEQIFMENSGQVTKQKTTLELILEEQMKPNKKNHLCLD